MKIISKGPLLLTLLFFILVFNFSLAQAAMVKITLEPNPEEFTFFEISILLLFILVILFGIFKVVKKKK